MPAVSESLVTLRIFGDSLDPDEVTSLLGKEPTKGARKGSVTTGRQTGRQFVARRGSWLLEATTRSPEDLDGQIAEILDAVTNDLSVWKALCNQFSVDLFCGLFLKKGNEGLTLNPNSLSRLGERGISLDLDIYGPSDEIRTRGNREG